MIPQTTSWRLTKVLVKVTVNGSFGAVKVVIPTEETVEDLIKTVLKIYLAEKRRPLLQETDSHRFELHYSSYSFESLNEKEKVINLGSRDFFMCLKPVNNINTSVDYSLCSKEANKEATNLSSIFPCTNLMNNLY